MKLKDWLNQLGRGKGIETELSDATILDLIRYIENSELDCGQVFDTLDQYAEIEVRKEDAARLMPLVRNHMDMCSECCDEYEDLLDVLAKASSTPEA
jgi:hypothetical protein